MKPNNYPAILVGSITSALALIALSQLLSHHLQFGWSLACDLMALACIFTYCVFAGRMDREQEEKQRRQQYNSTKNL